MLFHSKRFRWRRLDHRTRVRSYRRSFGTIQEIESAEEKISLASSSGKVPNCLQQFIWRFYLGNVTCSFKNHELCSRDRGCKGPAVFEVYNPIAISPNHE